MISSVISDLSNFSFCFNWKAYLRLFKNIQLMLHNQLLISLIFCVFYSVFHYFLLNSYIFPSSCLVCVNVDHPFPMCKVEVQDINWRFFFFYIQTFTAINIRLSPVLPAFHEIWYVLSLYAFIAKYFIIYIVIILLMIYLVVCCLISIHVDFSQFLLEAFNSITMC